MKSLPPAVFFDRLEAFWAWLDTHHATRREIWVGFHRKGTGTAGLDYDAAVEVALCFGWIDGIRKKLDDTRYANRFTPRKPGSAWSGEIARVERLTAAGLMHEAGLRAFAGRDPARSSIYSFEQRPEAFPPDLERAFRRHRRAWTHFTAQPPGYRRLAIWFVVSAKREETRQRRLAQLIEMSGQGQRLGVLFGQTGGIPTPGNRGRARIS